MYLIPFFLTLSVLSSLHNRDLDHPLVANLLERVTTISLTKYIVFAGFLAMLEFKEMKKAEMAVKESLTSDIHDMKIPFCLINDTLTIAKHCPSQVF